MQSSNTKQDCARGSTVLSLLPQLVFPEHTTWTLCNYTFINFHQKLTFLLTQRSSPEYF